MRHDTPHSATHAAQAEPALPARAGAVAPHSPPAAGGVPAASVRDRRDTAPYACLALGAQRKRTIRACRPYCG
jgi:hypothetical protein